MPNYKCLEVITTDYPNTTTFLVRLYHRLAGIGEFEKYGRVPDKKFNMRYYYATEAAIADSTRPDAVFIDYGRAMEQIGVYNFIQECGTQACALGWGYATPEMRADYGDVSRRDGLSVWYEKVCMRDEVEHDVSAVSDYDDLFDCGYAHQRSLDEQIVYMFNYLVNEKGWAREIV